MHRAVLDTNVIVSGLLNPRGAPGALLDAVANGKLTPVYSDPVFEEYVEVLNRPKLRLDHSAVLNLLLLFAEVGDYVALLKDIYAEIREAHFPDPDDIPFYATALAGGCSLVTGNLKHYPRQGPVEVLTTNRALERI